MVTFKVVKLEREKPTGGTFRIWFVVEGSGINHRGLLAHFQKHVDYRYYSDYRWDLHCTIHSIGNRPAGDELDVFKQFIRSCKIWGVKEVTIGGLHD